MIEYESELTFNESGFCYHTLPTEESVRLLTDLSHRSSRRSALDWVDMKDAPISLQVGSKAPVDFTKIVTPIPHREKQHTIGQPLALAHTFDCQRAIRQRLSDKNSNLRTIADQSVQNMMGMTIQKPRLEIEAMMPCATVDITTFNGRVGQHAASSGQWKELVSEMDGVTDEIPHLKHTWNEERRGNVWVVPETSILHRRVGQDTVQVVWHVDTFRGFIIFCLLNDQPYPHRVLFQQNGEMM